MRASHETVGYRGNKTKPSHRTVEWDGPDPIGVSRGQRWGRMKEKMVKIPLAELKRFERMEAALAEFVSYWRFEVRTPPKSIRYPKRKRSASQAKGQE